MALLVSAGSAQVAPSTDVPQDTGNEAAVQGPVLPPQLQPVARILGWSFKDELEEQPLRQGSGVVLDAGHPELILFFTAANARSQPVEFRYRLDDYDADWTLTHDHDAHYRRLAPGRYRFEVQARLRGQPWVTAMAVVPVTQRPFFYQTWYAGGLVLLVIVAIAVQLLHQRDQLLKGQMGVVLEERHRIASDCHDTLMAGFAAVSWQLESTQAMLLRGGAADVDAARSCELARSMVTHCQAEARRIIWDLRSPEGITDLLSEGVESAVAAHRLRESVPTVLRVEGDEIPISPGAVHHLVCICQEAMTNAIHHAAATRIDITLRFLRDSINLSVADNGRGFPADDTAVRTGHFGIAVMEERARKLGGTLRLLSAPGVGTEVAVDVRFQGEYEPLSQQAPVVPWIGV